MARITWSAPLRLSWRCLGAPPLVTHGCMGPQEAHVATLREGLQPRTSLRPSLQCPKTKSLNPMSTLRPPTRIPCATTTALALRTRVSRELSPPQRSATSFSRWHQRASSATWTSRICPSASSDSHPAIAMVMAAPKTRATMETDKMLSMICATSSRPSPSVSWMLRSAHSLSTWTQCACEHWPGQCEPMSDAEEDQKVRPSWR